MKNLAKTVSLIVVGQEFQTKLKSGFPKILYQPAVLINNYTLSRESIDFGAFLCFFFVTEMSSSHSNFSFQKSSRRVHESLKKLVSRSVCFDLSSCLDVLEKRNRFIADSTQTSI